MAASSTAMGDHARALDLAQRALELQSKMAVEDNHTLLLPWAQLGQSQLAAGHSDAAAASLKHALSRFDERWHGRQMRAVLERALRKALAGSSR